MTELIVPSPRPFLIDGEEVVRSREIIEQALERFGDSVAVMWSTGKDSTVVLDMVRQIRPDIKVYFIESHEFPETMTYLHDMQARWALNLHVLRQRAISLGGDTILQYDEITPQRLYDRASLDFRGISANLLYWTVMKIMPMEQVTERAVITGMRWDEDLFRQFLTYDEDLSQAGAMRSGHVGHRIHPLLHFSEYDSHRYLDRRRVPKHPLYARGYRSLGDRYTTHPSCVSERSGRQQSLRTIIYMASVGYLQSIGSN